MSDNFSTMKPKKQPKLLRDEVGNVGTIKIYRGDIAQIGGGVMICPTDSKLSKLPGICTYIMETGGQSVLSDVSVKKRDGVDLNPGECVVTTGGTLHVNRLVHLSIPQYDKNDPEPLLRSTINRLLNFLEVLQVNSVVIPCLNKEAFGFTSDHCAYAYMTSILEYLSSHSNTSFKEFKLVCKDKKESSSFEKQADRNFGKKEKKSIFSIFKKKKKTKEKNVGLELGAEEKKQ